MASASEFDTELKFAKTLAHEAGDIMRANYRNAGEITIKSDQTPVSEVDHKINRLVIERVSAAFPKDGVLGEEASMYTNRQRLWVCDPIDGTIAFLRHSPTSTFMLALVVDGQPQLGVILNPWTQELFWAAQGQGAWCNEQRIHVSNRGKKPSDRVAIAGASSSMSASKLEQPESLAMLRERGWRTFNLSGIGQKGIMVADGGLDGVVFGLPNAYDVAAIYPIVTEAGGKVTDLAGRPQRYDGSTGGAIITNGVIHDELLHIVRKAYALS